MKSNVTHQKHSRRRGTDNHLPKPHSPRQHRHKQRPTGGIMDLLTSIETCVDKSIRIGLKTKLLVVVIAVVLLTTLGIVRILTPELQAIQVLAVRWISSEQRHAGPEQRPDDSAENSPILSRMKIAVTHGLSSMTRPMSRQKLVRSRNSNSRSLPAVAKEHPTQLPPGTFKPGVPTSAFWDNSGRLRKLEMPWLLAKPSVQGSPPSASR